MIHGSAEISISAPELGRFSYFYGQLRLHCIFFCSFSLFAFTVPTSFSLFLNHKQDLSNLANIHRKKLNLASLVLNSTFLLKEIQSLCVFCLHSFPTTTSARVFLCCEKYKCYVAIWNNYIRLLTFTVPLLGFLLLILLMC